MKTLTINNYIHQLTEFSKKYPFLPLLASILLAIFLSWPYFTNCLGPDACSYLDIGANLAQGKGYTSTILTWFAELSPITHSALIEKQPLFPLLLAVFIYFFGLYKIVLLKAFLFLFYLGSLFLIYDWLREKEGIKVAFWATLFLATNPILQAIQLDAVNYSLFIFLVTLTIYIYLKSTGEPSSLLLGLVTGLAYLTRLEGSLVFLFLAAGYLFSKKWRSLFYFFLVFIFTISPLLIARQIKYGDFNKSIHIFQYRTLLSASEVMWTQGVKLKTFSELFSQHKGQILRQIGYNVETYSKFILGPYSLFIFFALMIFFRPHFLGSKQEFYLLYLFILWLLSLILHWPMTHIYDRSFLTSPLVFIITPIYVTFLENFSQAKLSNILGDKAKYIMPLIILTTIIINQVYARPFTTEWQARGKKELAKKQPVLNWIKRNVPQNWPICADAESSFLINYYTRRPTLNLPWDLSPINIDQFLKNYPLKVIIFSDDYIMIDYLKMLAKIKRWSMFKIPNSSFTCIMLLNKT